MSKFLDTLHGTLYWCVSGFVLTWTVNIWICVIHVYHVCCSWWLLKRFWSQSATWIWKITLLWALKNWGRNIRNWSGSKPLLPNQSGFTKLISILCQLIFFLKGRWKRQSYAFFLIQAKNNMLKKIHSNG